MELIQGASKMFGHISRATSSNKEKSSYKRMSVNEWFFEFN